ncbi:hypothetical protein [Streptomyces sp. SAI-090]|uniref:hypothetical protein n=1 Tax=Streptomyces sp. SAI-090 TaxID=2940545 RepID=UPI0024740B12|nr:hypothetical protein [Streptomyces sp. SAI-090]MDH6522029.1 DNA-binding FadR family transcriptional regulator [Streptomyces sp. SAI-090]
MSAVSAVVPSEAWVRAVYEFVDARLDEELRAEYPTADSEPVVDVYRVRLGEAQTAYRGFVEAVHRGDQDAARLACGELGAIAERWQAHPDFPGPGPLLAEGGGR